MLYCCCQITVHMWLIYQQIAHRLLIDTNNVIVVNSDIAVVVCVVGAVTDQMGTYCICTMDVLDLRVYPSLNRRKIAMTSILPV
jgi:hypothetical protein